MLENTAVLKAFLEDFTSEGRPLSTEEAVAYEPRSYVSALFSELTPESMTKAFADDFRALGFEVAEEIHNLSYEERASLMSACYASIISNHMDAELYKSYPHLAFLTYFLGSVKASRDTNLLDWAPENYGIHRLSTKEHMDLTREDQLVTELWLIKLRCPKIEFSPQVTALRSLIKLTYHDVYTFFALSTQVGEQWDSPDQEAGWCSAYRRIQDVRGFHGTLETLEREKVA